MTTLNASEFIRDLQVDGRLTFTTEEALARLERSAPAVRAQLLRLKLKGDIVDPSRGFYVIVPPAYRRLGCIPPEQFVPHLMRFFGQPYYVGLLSAAAYHGAAHQAPMVFQVIVEKPRRSLVCGGVKVDFIVRHDMAETRWVERNVPTGRLRISTPATTACELVGYPERCGYLDNVATVLSELAEKISPDQLAAEARRVPTAWVQRLGWLLQHLELNELTAVLKAVLASQQTFPVPLAPWLPTDGAPRNKEWRIIENTTVEDDL